MWTCQIFLNLKCFKEFARCWYTADSRIAVKKGKWHQLFSRIILGIYLLSWLDPCMSNKNAFFILEQSKLKVAAVLQRFAVQWLCLYNDHKCISMLINMQITKIILWNLFLKTPSRNIFIILLWIKARENIQSISNIMLIIDNNNIILSSSTDYI